MSLEDLLVLSGGLMEFALLKILYKIVGTQYTCT